MGWHAPFIFCIIVLAFDLVARLLVIERKHLADYDDLPQDLQTPAIDVEKSRTSPPSEAALPQEKAPVKELSPWGVLVALAKSPRGMNGALMTFIFGMVLGVLDPTYVLSPHVKWLMLFSLTLRVQTVWDKNADFVGLVYRLSHPCPSLKLTRAVAACAPTFITGPLVGALADKFGSEWIITPFLLVSLPWFPLLILKNSLPGFIVYFAMIRASTLTRFRSLTRQKRSCRVR